MVTMECKNQGDFKFTYRLYNSDSSSKYSHHYSSEAQFRRQRLPPLLV
jgi:hypothetical protein